MKVYEYKYLIIGGGMTADAAARSIKETDPKGTIGIISREEDPPYARPPLSKSIWRGEEKIDDIYLGTENVSLKIHLGRIAEKIDRSNKEVTDNQGDVYKFEKLLIATGGTPKKLPNIEETGIIYYRTVSDYKKLKNFVDKNKTFGIFGGGFIGSEIAAAIKIYKPKAEVTMIFPENGICGLIFPKTLSDYLNGYYREKGIKVLTGEMVSNVKQQGKVYLVETKSGKNLKFDCIIAGLGINPNIDLAKAADLNVENGIVVNNFLQTNDKEIYAAGDVAYYFNPALTEYIRVEHEDNALMMGEIAGKNMTGEEIPFDHLSLFYSDLFDLGYEAVGILNSKLEMVEDIDDSLEEGIVYYLKEGRVKGVLLWNVWEKVDEARKLIAEQGPFSPEDLKGRIK
ncbi:MAG: NAD(P)/FAD-dependent oxidoreductase [Promethearchaeota archaeon]